MKEIGPIVPIVTPCAPDGAVDLESFRAVCAEMTLCGYRGIFVGGSTGRGPWFTLADRARLCSAAAQTVPVGTLILAGCMSLGLPGMLEASRAMAEAGAVIAVATVPGYYRYNEEEAGAIFLAFADRSPIPVFLYDIPEFVNLQFSRGLLLDLARHGNIIGLKDSSADLPRFEALLQSLRDRADFSLLQGKEKLISESLRLGASGFVVSVIHLVPRLFIDLYRAVRAGRDAEAAAFQAAVDGVMDVVLGCIRRRPESSTLFHILNEALKLRGVCRNVLLSHEGETPAWLAEEVQRAIQRGRVAQA